MNTSKTHTFLIICIFVLVSTGLSISSYSKQHLSNMDIENTFFELEGTHSIEPVQDSVYAIADIMPQFPGGKAAQDKFLIEHLKYPVVAQESNSQGRVIVQFIVSKTGKIEHAKIVKKVSPELDREALRIVNSYPDWIPGEVKGQKVSVYQLMPVSFKLIDQIKSPENTKIIAIDNLKMPANFDIKILNPSEIDTGYVTMPTTPEIKNQLIQKYGITAEKGVIEIYTNRFKRLKNNIKSEPWDTIAKINPNDKNAIYSSMDIDLVPKFIGGNKELYNFIHSILKYPVVCKETGIQGTAIVQFIIDKTGKVKDAVVKNKTHTLLASEALRVVNSLPDWIPGEKHGEKVNVRITLPIKFAISGIYPLENDSAKDINRPPDRQLIVLDGRVLPYGFDLNWLNSSNIHSYKLLVPKNDIEEKQFKLWFGPYSLKGILIATSKSYFSANKKDTIENHIYSVIEVMPEYPGGTTQLMQFIATNLKYPFTAQRRGVQGKVIIRFVVNSEGNIEKAEVVRSLDPDCDKEALRVVNLLPRWTPGRQKGVNVSVYYTLPISFRLN